ncbi:MAG: class I SAM-dependent methyltransferase [Pseudonocardia sp.]|nr:class I SAM-dependent methyltransferase [Pseudonocardia sp.]
MRSGPAIPSPNIWHWPDVYAWENAAQDSTGAIWAHLREVAPWAGYDVVDVGCGDGFHLPVFAAEAASVVGVEPHPPLVERARARVTGTPIEVLRGGAEALPLPDRSADVVHARTAYFFGEGCEPGLLEADRVLRPGGVLAVVDLDFAAAPYGNWLRADLPKFDPVAVEGFFHRHGFRSRSVDTVWRFEDRATLEAVLRIEFSAAVAARAIAETTGLTIDVGYRIRTRRRPVTLLRA